MTRSSFDPRFEDLPRTLPIFPLSGVLLLPGGKLPLNIFEPRYLAMIRAALAGPRLIGMIQPRDPDAGGQQPEVQRVGCAGRVTSFAETDDNRYLITLTGLCRFTIMGELPPGGAGLGAVPGRPRSGDDRARPAAPHGGAARLLRRPAGAHRLAGDRADGRRPADRVARHALPLRSGGKTDPAGSALAQ